MESFALAPPEEEGDAEDRSLFAANSVSEVTE
jgi:hypothetical protein